MGDNDAPSRPVLPALLCSLHFSLPRAWPVHATTTAEKNRVLPKPRQARLDELQACDGPLLLSTTTPTTLLFSHLHLPFQYQPILN